MNAIAQYRKEMGMTQAELAERLGVTQTTISDVERGLKKFSHTKAMDIEKRTNGKLRREALRPDIYE